MRNHIDISLARFLMIFSLVLLGVLEYLWLNNEYKDKYRDMEDKLNHVMFSTIRDVEDSLIFSNLADLPYRNPEDGERHLKYSILIDPKDSLQKSGDCVAEKKVDMTHARFRSRFPMRGILLERLSSDTALADSLGSNMSSIVMKHLKLSDSTGEYAAYKIITWQSGGDTVVGEVMSRPQYDILAGNKMALVNPNYKADIFQDLLPHISFALFLWVMVGAAFYYIWKNLRRQIQLNALRDEFVSNITHELKTPITTVGVALESLKMSDDLKQGNSRKYLEICQGELKRLSMLVERILHSQAPNVQYEKMDVRQVLGEVMDQMKVQFDNRHAQVEIQQEGDGFMIQGDKTHISGVLFNLLDNALKYSPDQPVIKVHLARNNGSIRLEVKDNGLGIDPEYHEKIFEKLFRAPNQDRHDVKGHGLGLSYVADVVKKHHGKIDVVSEPGKGSTFSMILPAWHETKEVRLN